MVVRGLRSIALIGLLLTSVPALALFTASVDTDSITEADTLELTLRYEGADHSGEPDYAVLRDDFEIEGTPSVSRQFQMTTEFGRQQTSSSTSWVLTLKPKRLGRLRIPAIHYQGEATDPIEITVSRLSEAARSRMARIAFLLTSIDHTDAYVQQQIVYTLKFYTQYSYQGDLPEAPAFEHALVKPLGDARNYRTRYNGIQYLVREWRFAIFPQQSGKLEIPALNLSGQVQVRPSTFFDNGQWQRVQTGSQGYEIRVKPVPPGFHGGTWLPASALSLADSWAGASPTFRVGDPVNRTLTIEADGLPRSALPSLQQPSPDNARIYSDPPAGDETNGDEGIHSRQSVTFGIVPTAAGRLEFPEIVINWWNTEKDQAETIRIPAASFDVRPSPTSAQPSVQNNFAAPAATAPSAPPVAPPSVTNLWTYVAALFAAAWLITLLFWLINRRHLRETIRAQRAAASAPTPAMLNESRRFEELTRGCRDNDPPAAREALLQWARSLYPSERPINLEEFRRRAADPKFDRLLEELDQVLYAPTDRGAWKGDALLATATALRSAAQKTNSVDRDAIPALNPA